MDTTVYCLGNTPGRQKFAIELSLATATVERDVYLAVTKSVCRVFNDVRLQSINLFLRLYVGDGDEVNYRIDGPNTLVVTSPSENGLKTTTLISSEKAYNAIGAHVAMAVSDDFMLQVEFDDTFTNIDRAIEFTRVAAKCVAGIATAIVRASRYYSSAFDAIATFEAHTAALGEELAKLHLCEKGVDEAHSPKVSHYSFNGGDYMRSHPHLSKRNLLFSECNTEMMSCFVTHSRYAAHISSRMETLLLETVLHAAHNVHKESVATTMCVAVFSPCVHTVDMQLLVDLIVTLVGVDATKRYLLDAASTLNSPGNFSLSLRGDGHFATLVGIPGRPITTITFQQLAANNFVLSKVVTMQCNIFSELEFAYSLIMSPEVIVQDNELTAALNCALATWETAEAVDPKLMPWRLR